MEPKVKIVWISLLGIIIVSGVIIGSLVIFSTTDNAINAPNLKNIFSPDLDGEFEIEWSSVEGAEQYKLFRSSKFIDPKKSSFSEKDLQKIYEGENSVFFESTLAPKTYYYVVCAISADGTKSDYSNCVEIEVSYPTDAAILNNVDTPNEGGNFTVSWSSINHASFYYLYRVPMGQTELNCPIYEGICCYYEEKNLALGSYSYYVQGSNGVINSTTSNCISVHVLPKYEKVLLTEFPIPLNKFFKDDLPAQKTSKLSGIQAGQTEAWLPFIDPYPNYWHKDHYPGTLKWYMYADRYLPLSLSIDSYLVVDDIMDNINVTINGSTVMKNLCVSLYLNYYIRIGLDHMCLNESVYNQWLVAPEVGIFGADPPKKGLYLPADTNFGFTHDNYALDLIIYDSHNQTEFKDYPYELDQMKNPYFYFTEAMQNEIDAYYQDQLDAMHLSGEYIQGYLNHSYDIHDNATLSGTWWYKDGPFDLNETHHQMGWYSFDGCILNLLNINKTDPYTFHGYSGDPIGMYVDADYCANVEGYDRKGIRYMYHEEGNNKTQGILRAELFPGGGGDTWIRYRLIQGNQSITDDLLWIEYFDTLVGAQGGFTSNRFIYERMPSFS